MSPCRKLGAVWLLLIVPAVFADEALLSIEPIDAISQDTKTEIKFTLKAKPADAPQVRFAVDRLRRAGKPVEVPRNLKIDPATGAVSWTPTPSQAGAYELTLTAKDGKDNEATATVKITVRERAVTTDNGEVGKLLRQWVAEGTAAGNTGDFYDNRDRDHSALHRALYPQLDEVMYSPEERKAYRDWAAQHVILPHVTFGNSSTSAPVTGGGSNVRMYYTHPRGLAFLYEEYRKNNIYMYPAHHDHHPGHNGKPFYGDVYPTNSPYLITSQGSSGSDQPFMRAVPFTLAAFRPEVKAKLIETGLLMPTVQMILRYTNKHLTDPKEYLSGKAHPPVFEGSWVSDVKMIRMAHDMQPDNIPPMIQLKVVEEDKPEIGRDYFEPGVVGEVLADTPAVIARVVRGGKRVRRMVVSAEDSFDVNKRPLAFHWVVLRGDAEHITIKPMNKAGSVVEILVPYQERCPVAGHHLKIESNRVDIGAFVHNGVYFSAPGFITFYTLDNEMRTYDDKGRLVEIGYGAGDVDLNVTDWNALFDMVNAPADGLPGRVLQQSLTAEQRGAIAKMAGDYRAASAELTAAQAKSKQTADVHQKAIAELKTADDKVKAAQKTNENDPGEETLMAYKKAAIERDAVDDRRRSAEADFHAAQKAVDAARKTAEGILTQKRPGLDRSIKEVVEAELNGIKANPNFFDEHAKDIEALSQASDPAHQARISAARKRLVGFGVLKESDAKLPEGLTRYGKNLVERCNAEVICTLVYPKLLTQAFRPNFIDFRLTTQKTWRDVYHHDGNGKVIGWTRSDGVRTTDFNAAGQVVLEKDTRGRAVKARTVKYVMDNTAKGPTVRTLKQLPGDQIIWYAYESDDDFTGKVTKQEAVEEKK